MALVKVIAKKYQGTAVFEEVLRIDEVFPVPRNSALLRSITARSTIQHPGIAYKITAITFVVESIAGVRVLPLGTPHFRWPGNRQHRSSAVSFDQITVLSSAFRYGIPPVMILVRITRTVVAPRMHMSGVSPMYHRQPRRSAAYAADSNSVGRRKATAAMMASSRPGHTLYPCSGGYAVQPG